MKVNITTVKSGVEKQLFQMKAPERDGLILQIHNTPQEANKQRIRYTQTTINKMGQLMAATNQKGDLLMVDVVNFKFWTIPTLHSCTVIQFSPLNDCEILMGCVNGSVQIVNIETGEIVGSLAAHKYSISGISFSKDYFCLTSSTCEAILWNLRTNLQMQTLNLVENNLLKFIRFMPVTNNILACFQDDSMQVWTYENFQSYRKILPSSWNKSSVKCLAITRNGRAMVVGGHTSYLAIFLLDLWEYTKTIKLPEYIQSVKYLDFISEPFDGGSNRILAILSGNGIAYFYSMATCKVINKLLAVQEILRFSISGDGKYLVCILSTGEINMYLLNTYLKEQLQVEKKPEKPRQKHIKKTSSQLTKCSTTSSIEKELQQILDLEKLQKILKEFGTYPDDHRLKIWTQLLQLPNNLNEYRVINNNALKTPFDRIEKEYALQNKVAIKNLKKTLINVCTWSPFFKNVDYLPVFIFPFIHIFQNEPVLCFEAICSIILNWCQHWFEYYPMPPINVLAMLENVMLEHDVKLLRHLSAHQVTSQVYAWSLLEVAFTETLQPKSWQMLWDHIFSTEPAFILLATVAYNLIFRNTLLSFKTLEDFEFFYHNQNPVSIKKLVAKTYHLLETTSEANHPRQYLNSFRSVAGKSYPMFSDFPKATLEYKARERDALSFEKNALKLETSKLMELRRGQVAELSSKRKNEIEEERVRALEDVCKEKVRSESERIQQERMRIAILRKKLSEEEVALVALNSKQIKESRVTDKRAVLEDLISTIDDNRVKNEIDVIHTETELLRHYSDLLKNRLQIEGLFSDRSSSVDTSEQVRRHQELLLDEISKIKSLVDSRAYLKQLSISTGVAAMDSLIQRVETELKQSPSAKGGKHGNSKVATLQAESLDLELRVKDLLSLLEEHKQMNAAVATRPKARSLTRIDEIDLDVMDINSADNLMAARADGDMSRRDWAPRLRIM